MADAVCRFAVQLNGNRTSQTAPARLAPLTDAEALGIVRQPIDGVYISDLRNDFYQEANGRALEYHRPSGANGAMKASHRADMDSFSRRRL